MQHIPLARTGHVTRPTGSVVFTVPRLGGGGVELQAMFTMPSAVATASEVVCPGSHGTD